MAERPYEFRYDARLGIDRPVLHVAYERLSKAEREAFEYKCQQVCSRIPLRIQALERTYMTRYAELEHAEADTDYFAILNEMNDISSRISELNVLFLHIEGRFLASDVRT